MHSLSNATLQFGLVSIPVKVYSAASARQVSFNWLSPKQNRVCEKLFDKVTGEEISHSNVVKAFEFEKERYVTFTKEELAIIKKEKGGDRIEICEAIKDLDISPLTVEKSFYLLPNNSDRAFRLLFSVLKSSRKYIVAKWFRAGKDNLVAIGPHRNLLVMYQLYYENEIKTIEPSYSEGSEPSQQEIKLAKEIVSKITGETFKLSDYKDEFQSRLLAAIEQKKKGQAIYSEEQIETNVLDLVNLLKKSIS